MFLPLGGSDGAGVLDFLKLLCLLALFLASTSCWGNVWPYLMFAAEQVVDDGNKIDEI